MALTPEQKSLASHRFQRAEDTLKEAKDELSRRNFRLAVNRAYYSVFYAMRAFLATVDKDSSKHSGVLSIFNQHFINTGIVSDVSVKAIQSLMDMRHEGDYQDFVEITEEEAKGSVETAEMAIEIMGEAFNRLIET
ncbi:MAG: antitoxin [Nitrospirae bacterium CG_4_10_14_3_um_filter_44_29]|nr:HEPN domain-containing protein [Nitrospirota bacterium]PIX89568.1 MAG: antitoxin [Nitrospirae bacterium CG_4_10_14_3_um_filter_44_29]PJA82181.1 MAG: antitoxin [Nitrospirae bacterium CG_4_9_14_3_um_filter_44_28]